MAFDVANAQALLKKTYPDGVVEMDYKKSKTLALMQKKKGTVVKGPFGLGFDVPVKHGNPQGGSATYATGYAQASTEQSRSASWSVTPATNFHFADVGSDIIRRGASAGSFVEALTWEIENAKDAARRIMEIQLFKGGFGDLVQLSATANVASATGVALLQPWMVRFVEKGMSVVFSASEAANVLRGATPVKVVGRHAAAGTLDFSFAPNTAGTAAAVSDFMFRDGDRQNSATPSRLCASGFKAWVPQTAPSATAFFGVDRSVDDRLGGLRQDGSTSGNVEEAFLDADMLVQAEGGMVTHYTMGPLTYNKMVKSLSNRIQYVEMMTDVDIAVAGFKLPGSDAMFYADNACDEGISFGWNIEEVDLRYAGDDLLYIEQTDGLMFREVAGSDVWRSRLVSCWNLVMPAPGHAVQVFGL